MLKRWFSTKEIEVYLLCEILISKDTLQGQKNCCEPPLIKTLVFTEQLRHWKKIMVGVSLIKIKHMFVLV